MPSSRNDGLCVPKEVPEENGKENHATSKQGETSWRLSKGKEDPEGVEDWLNHWNQAGLKSLNLPYGLGIEEVGKPNLHRSKEHKSCEAPPTGEGAEAEGEACQGGEEIAHKHRLQGFSVFLHSQGDDEEGKGNAAANGHEVSKHVPQAQLVKEEEHHSSNHEDHGDPVETGGNLAKEPLAEEGNIHRSAILEEDGVGSGGEFVGKHKEHHRCGVGKASENLKAGKAEAGAEKAEEKSAGNGAPGSGNRHRIPADELDEQAAKTPE